MSVVGGGMGGTVRSVTVRFDADIASYLTKAALVRKATNEAIPDKGKLAASNQELGRTETRLGGVERQASKTAAAERVLGREVDNTTRKLETGQKSIDRYSGRLGVLLDLAVGIGPALVPIAAELVPLTAALGSNLAFIGVGGATGILALHGVGDALKAFNKAALEPTATNIEAAQRAMDKLPPSAQRFVLQLHRMIPDVQHLQQLAANGFLPGAAKGLHELEDDLPVVSRIIRGTSQELGTLAEDTGQALSSRRWRPFLRFLGTETPQALDTLGRAGGRTLHGLFELLMAFDPLTDDIDQGLLRLATDFDRWASKVGQTKDFQSFLQYLRDNGPRVLDLLGDLATTFLDIAEAVAPLGGPTIDILDHVLEIVDTIANSDLGTPLFAGLVAFRLYARTMQLLGREVDTSWRGIVAAPRQLQVASSTMAGSVRATTTSAIADLRLLGTEYGRTNRLQSTGLALMSNTSGAAQRTNSRLASLAKGGAIAAGVALTMSGAAESVGLANTASLALAGSLAGPVGAGVGAAVGFTMDLAHANDDLAASVDAVSAAYDNSGVVVDIASQGAALDDLTAKTAAYQAEVRDAWTPGGSHNPLTLTKQGVTALGDLFTGAGDKADEAAARARESSTLLNIALRDIGGGLGRDPLDMINGTQLQQVADRAQPAMLALGITVQDLVDAAHAGDGSLNDLTGSIVKWINQADSAKGRTDAVADAFAHMSDESLTAEQRVDALKSSLDALIDPMLNAGRAHDAFSQGLNDLKGSLADGNRGLKGNTNAAIQNRNVIRDQVDNLKSWIESQADAGASAESMTRNLKAGRQAILDAAQAAGLNRDEVKAMIDRMNLTPKLIRTTFSLLGTEQSLNDLRNVNRELLGLRDRVIHVTVKLDRLGPSDTNTTGGRVLTGADGGRIPKDGLAYGDRVPTLTAPGEFILSNRHGQVDRNLGLIKAINSNRYADGGRIGGAPRMGTLASASSGASSVRVAFPNGLELTGVLSTEFGPATVRAIATDTHHTESAAQQRFEEARS